MEFQTTCYLDLEGNLQKDAPQISEEVLLKAYTTMMQTRLLDEQMIHLQRQGIISFALSSLGEEACAVASAAALDLQDWMYPQYREAGVMFWRGFSIQDYTNHMFCNACDIILGRQMPNHFGARYLNVVTVSSPIGTKIPHAAGCGYAMKLQKEKTVAICYFGEGASSEGDFHAGLNFAAVRKTPTIFFCRNNGYAISTPVKAQLASDGVFPKAVGYGVTGIRVDGNDFFAVYDAVAKARQQCIEGRGPVLIEAMTYRLGAHSTSDDPSRYRPDTEVETWKNKCPIKRLRLYLEKKGIWSEKQEKELIQTIAQEIEVAIERSKQVCLPDPKSLFEHVYFEIPSNLCQQRDSIHASS